MILTTADLSHLKYIVEELLFRLKEDDDLLISDLEDEIKICAEIVGINPNIEQSDYE
jgi:hypothetical protein